MKKLRLIFQFRPETMFVQFSQTEQSNQYVLFRILISQEGLPAVIGYIISSNQLHLIRLQLLINLLNADLPGPHISAGQIHILHFLKSQLANITMFHPTGHQGHRDIALNAVHACPRRHQS